MHGAVTAAGNRIGFLTRHDAGNLLGFAGTNVRGCIRLGAMLQQTIAYHRTGGFGERRQLSQ